MQNTESQCHRFLLQIDDYLDQQLDQLQIQAVEDHLQTCTACQEELVVAQQLQIQLADLHFHDCPDRLLSPLMERAKLELAATQPERKDRVGLLPWLQDLVGGGPVLVRVAIPVLFLAALGTSWTVLQRDGQRVEQASNLELAPRSVQPLLIPASVELQEYSAEEIQQALLDLNLAIQYLNGISQRTEKMIGDRFLITPLQDTFNASFENIRDNRPLRRGGPI